MSLQLRRMVVIGGCESWEQDYMWSYPSGPGRSLFSEKIYSYPDIT